MARDFVVNGETLVKVAGTAALDRDEGVDWELGLSVDEIRIIPRFIHHDIKADDFGPEIPANIIWNLCDVSIRMTLVHYDDDVLDRCISNSMGGQVLSATNVPQPGKLVAAGTILGGLFNPASATRHDKFIAVTLESPQFDKPYTFPHCYLSSQPLEIPLGTTRTIVQLAWRSIPFVQPDNPSSDGIVLWNN